ncbi:MAG: hypothetical protein RSG07_05230 [Erysipelotrichaceae bacterium]
MKKQVSLKTYLLEKCLIGYGIINGIINAGIFYAMEAKHPDAMFAYPDAVIDISITTLLLGMILMYCALPLTLKDMNAGKFEVPKNAVNKIVAKLPKKKFLAALVIGLMTMAVAGGISALIAMVLPLPLTVKQMGIFKGVACSIGGGIAGYLTINKAISDKQEVVNKAA